MLRYRIELFISILLEGEDKTELQTFTPADSMRGSYRFTLNVDIEDFFASFATQEEKDNRKAIIIGETPIDFAEFGIPEDECTAFEDANKCRVKFIPLVDDKTLQGYSVRAGASCWNCREDFYGTVWGAPLEYHHPKKGDRLYHVLKTLTKSRNLDTRDDVMDFFLAEGTMCSPECAKTYIIDKIAMTGGSAKYNNALTCLNLLIHKMTGESRSIKTRHDIWKLSKRWGGCIEDGDIKSIAGNLEYIPTVNVKRPLLYSIAPYIEETTV